MRSKTIDIIMDTLFLKSNRESQHSARVSMICELIASNLNFEKDDVNQIKIAGLIHDIGKIGIDEKILNKAGRLNNNEWEEIRKHPEAGWRILSSTKEFSELARFVLHHHEKFDGSGYPNGLKGEEIPIEARIITIADAYDAITSERSYRKGVTKEKAIEEILSCSGTHFDPKIVDVLINKVLPEFI
jgi:putative nucleotidyltransferase with HDIG domain